MMIVKQKTQPSMSHVSKTTGNCLLTTMEMENNALCTTVCRYRERQSFYAYWRRTYEIFSFTFEQKNRRRQFVNEKDFISIRFEFCEYYNLLNIQSIFSNKKLYFILQYNGKLVIVVVTHFEKFMHDYYMMQRSVGQFLPQTNKELVVYQLNCVLSSL